MLYIKRLMALIIVLNTIVSQSSNQLKKTAFQKIENWEQVTKFQGAVVAYQADSSYLQGSLYPGNEGNLSYGYIRKGKPTVWGDSRNYGFHAEETGYSIQQLIKKEVVPSACALINSKIKEGGLKMRMVTMQEKACICEMLNKGTSRFAYGYNEDEIRLVLDCPQQTD